MSLSDTYRKRESLFAGTFLAIVSFTLAGTIRHNWIALCGGFCPVDLTLHEAPYAPEVYRIGLPILNRWINLLFHFHDATLASALIDFLSSFAALSIFCSLALQNLSTLRDTLAARMLTLALFLAFIQFPIGFVYFHQRGETLPTTLFLALALFCLTRSKVPSRTSALWVLLLFAATAGQSFLRADVPFLFGVAMLLLSLIPGILADFGSISWNLLRAAGVTLIAGGIQAYLKWIRFPDRHYGPEHAIVLKLNLNPTPLSLLALSLFPFLWMALLILRRRIRLNAVEALIAAASLLYLPIWFTVGLVSEVRIFVPFLLALCVVAARVSASYLLSPSLPGSPPLPVHAE